MRPFSFVVLSLALLLATAIAGAQPAAGRPSARRVPSASRPVARPATPVVSPFGGMTESGLANRNPGDNMTGDAVGTAFGYGGLGATGTGWGGGGTGEGNIGMGDIGSMGHGSGVGSGQGYSSGAGRGLRGRGTEGPSLAPEAIRRTVLRNIAQIDRCYQAALDRNPDLRGRVLTRFVIAGNGSVSSAEVIDAADTARDERLNTCVGRAMRTWQFAQPGGGGTTTVTYPFNLEPSDDAPPAPPARRRAGPTPQTPIPAPPARPAAPAAPSFTPARPFCSSYSMA